MMLHASNLHFGYPDGASFKNISLSLTAGTLTCLLGANGSGKSTLLRTLAGLLPLRGGSLHLHGLDAATLSREQRARCLAYVPQSTPSVALRVEEAVLMGRTPHMHLRSSIHDKDAVTQALAWLGLEHWRHRYLDELSGGERQKVLIARAIAQETPILLLDEPAGSLDIRHQLEVYALLQRLAHEQHKTILLTEHDLNLAARHADQVHVLHQRVLVAGGAPDAVLTASLLQRVYGVQSHVRQTGFGLSIMSVGLA